MSDKTTHEIVYVSEGMCDQYQCSCGWQSNTYFDGAHWAEKEAKEHVERMTTPEWPVPGASR